MPVLYRKPRFPSPLFSTVTDPTTELLAGAKVLDLEALWAWHGILSEEVRYGPTHGEADATEKSRLNGKSAVEVEAEVLWNMFQSRQRGPVKCIVVDLDDTLIHGLMAEDEFHRRNPAYLPEGETAVGTVEEGWWRLNRGLHTALRTMQQRGIVLALATRNDPDLLSKRFCKRPMDDTPLSPALHALSVGPSDFVTITAGFYDKSRMCRQIADRLGIGLDSLLLLDDSLVEREEVSIHAPGVRILNGKVEEFRQQLLWGPDCQVWEVTPEAALRAQSYRSRAAIEEVDPLSVETFLKGLQIQLTIRRALPSERPRVEELLRRTHQLNLTGKLPDLEENDLYVGFCRDRLSDHGLVAAGVFGGSPRQLLAWCCSCRVLPHRVAPTFLWAMLTQEPGVIPVRVPNERNGATMYLIEEAGGGPASWLQWEVVPLVL
jgi:FkbH-like protein